MLTVGKDTLVYADSEVQPMIFSPKKTKAIVCKFLFYFLTVGFPMRLFRYILAAAAAYVVAFPVLAECSIKSFSKDYEFETGSVVDIFTDHSFKIRVVAVNDSEGYIVVDVKAPGLQLKRVNLERDKMATWNICGSEVNVTFRGYTYRRISS